MANRHRVLDHFRVTFQMEQSPDPDNLIMLTPELDANGMPRTSVRMRFNETDLDSFGRAQEIFQQQFRSAGVGELQPADDLPFPAVESDGGIHHHLGGTRMHVSPSDGVVDANARVHGLGNLWIAGGSLFPTGGYANPTLTILALTLRLADQVKEELQSAPLSSVSVIGDADP